MTQVWLQQHQQTAMVMVVMATTLILSSWAAPQHHKHKEALPIPVTPVELRKSNPVNHSSSSAKSVPVDIPVNATLIKEITAQTPESLISIPSKQNITSVDNSQLVPAFLRNNNIQPCSNEGVYGIPNDCSYFYVCTDESTKKQYKQYLYVCDIGLHFIESEEACLQEECYSHKYDHLLNDPPMPPPPPQASQVMLKLVCNLIGTGVNFVIIFSLINPFRVQGPNLESRTSVQEFSKKKFVIFSYEIVENLFVKVIKQKVRNLVEN
ncbi:uncharacterized protein [Cherax quadricarinatus]|uniref:uncharacterized protein n=1 Tax=Cherax quadricarinatus TaxID=27406 RepID=UPI00387EB6EB